MKTRIFSRLPLALAGSLLLLAACGGGGGGDDAAPAPTDPLVSGTDVPTSATTSSASAFSLVNGVASSPRDTDEPFVVGDVTLATSETDEPDPSV